MAKMMEAQFFEREHGNVAIKAYVHQVAKKIRSSQLPELTYSALIALAIVCSKDQSLPLKQIYKFVDRFRNLLPAALHANWKNSVRHNLSVRKCFVRVKVSGAAGWTFRSESVTPKVTQMVLNEFKQFLSHAKPTSEPSSHTQSAASKTGNGWNLKGACDDVADAFLYSDCCADVISLRSRRWSTEMTMTPRNKQLHSSASPISISSPSMNTDSQWSGETGDEDHLSTLAPLLLTPSVQSSGAIPAVAAAAGSVIRPFCGLIQQEEHIDLSDHLQCLSEKGNFYDGNYQADPTSMREGKPEGLVLSHNDSEFAADISTFNDDLRLFAGVLDVANLDTDLALFLEL